MAERLGGQQIAPLGLQDRIYYRDKQEVTAVAHEKLELSDQADRVADKPFLGVVAIEKSVM